MIRPKPQAKPALLAVLVLVLAFCGLNTARADEPVAPSAPLSGSSAISPSAQLKSSAALSELAPESVSTPVIVTGASVPLSGTAPALTDAQRAEAAQLAKTLQDQASRDKLVAQLQILAQVNKPATVPTATADLLKVVFQSLQDASDTILNGATEIANVGELVHWATGQADDEKAQKRVGRVIMRLIVVMIGGIIIEWVLSRLLRRPARYVESRPVTNRWARVPLVIVRWIFELVPVAGFAASAYALLALPFYRPGGHSELVSVAVITAYALSATLRTLINAVFEPTRPTMRAIPLSDADAVRLNGWARRLAYTGVWGYYADQVLSLLGLPRVGYESILKLLGLALAIMIAMIVTEFRRPVSHWIRGSGTALPADMVRRIEIDRRVAGLRKVLADIWHVLAMLYVLAAFVIWALRVEGGFEFLLRATLLTAAIFVAGRVASSTLVRLVDRSFAATPNLPQHVAARRRRYNRLSRNAIRIVVTVLAVLGVLASWGADTLGWLGSDTGHRIVSALSTIVVVIVVAVMVWEGFNGAIERYLARTDTSGRPVARSARARTLLPLLRNALTFVLILIVALIVLSQLGVEVAPLIAGAGVVGVAIGFGSQKLVQDVITGAFILFEDTLAIGDTVTIGDHSGVVEGMTIRTVRLRSGTGELHTLPFSSITVVINQSRGFANFPFTIGVSYRQDADRAMDIMREVGEELRKDPVWGPELGAPVDVFGIDKFTDLAVMVSGQIRTMPGRQVPVGREYFRRLKKRFDELGIVIPHTVGPYEMAQAAVAAANPKPDDKPAQKKTEDKKPEDTDRREP